MDIEFNNQPFENAILSVLSQLCNEKESIHTDYLIPDKEDGNSSKPKLMVDFFLPKGCEAMEWKGPTCVEGKNSLTTTALTHARALSELSDYPIIIVTDERVGLNFKYDKIFNDGRDISWISLSYLYERLNSIKKSESTSISEDNQDEDDKSTAEKEKKAVTVVKESDPEELAKNAFKNGNITLFLGAGVSVGAGLPQWDSLLKELLKDDAQLPLDARDYAAIDVAAYNSNLITARYLLCPYSTEAKKLEGGDKLTEALYRDYDPAKSNLDLINAIVKMCSLQDPQKQRYVSSIITFNYDDLVEKAMKQEGIPFVSVTNDKKYELGKLPIVHVHGLLSQDEPNPIPILSEESYHRLYDTFNSITNVEIVHALYRNTCIFIGLSMTDPNLRRLLESVRNKSEENIYHYAILPSVSLDLCNWDAANPTKYYKENEEKNKEFRRRQEKVFESLGIKIIWFPNGEYGEIPKILKKIAGIDKTKP